MAPVDGGGRIDRLRERLEVPALLVTDLVNIRYLTGYTGSNAALLVPRHGSAVFFTDSRYAERAPDELRSHGANVEIRIAKTPKTMQTAIVRLAAAATRRAATGPLSADGRRSRSKRPAPPGLGLEAGTVSWAAAEGWRAAGLAIVAVHGAVEALRRTKDDGEIARLERACQIADDALAAALTVLSGGPTEVEFARVLESEMDRRGSEAPSFETIIASGPNASRPHHATGSRPIRRGDQVIIDFGATVDGYHSDMTRTVHVGEPTRAQRKHFRVVRDAQAAGVATVRAGVALKRVDMACRSVIGAAGWAEHFGHGTGHGIGLVIHEMPWIGPRTKGKLQIGDVVTVEPGVYMPGRGGVRVEDSVVVTAAGCRPLTLAPKDLVVE